MSLSEENVMKSLATVIDLEVGMNIVDMGLIYGVAVKNGEVVVRMTLTTQGCPMKSYMEGEVERALNAMEGVTGVNVDFVWDPPWSPALMNPEAAEALRSGNYR